MILSTSRKICHQEKSSIFSVVETTVVETTVVKTTNGGNACPNLTTMTSIYVVIFITKLLNNVVFKIQSIPGIVFCSIVFCSVCSIQAFWRSTVFNFLDSCLGSFSWFFVSTFHGQLKSNLCILYNSNQYGVARSLLLYLLQTGTSPTIPPKKTSTSPTPSPHTQTGTLGFQIDGGGPNNRVAVGFSWKSP